MSGDEVVFDIELCLGVELCSVFTLRSFVEFFEGSTSLYLRTVAL